MTIDSTTSASASLPPNHSSKSKPAASSKELDKATQVFKKAMTPEEKEAQYQRNREYYIKDIMETKGVSRDVAESEVDSL